MDLLDDIEALGIIYVLYKRHKQKNVKKIQRRQSVHPLNLKRLTDGQFQTNFMALRNNPENFFDYYRMSVSSFDDLMSLIGLKLQKQFTCLRSPILPEERLTVTLRYLATGLNFSALHLEFLMGISTVGKIVKETCQVLWEVLQPIEMPVPSVDDWLDIAAEFYSKTQFPNCVGAIDGKHIKLEYPKNSKTYCFKHKQPFSLIIFGICDANYCFKIIDVGFFENESDCNIFKKCAFGKTLYSNTVNFPPEICLPGDTEGIPQPHVIVGDEAFSLHTNLLRPFPARTLNDSRRIFNYRLSRARENIERTFSIFSNKWRVFHTAILASPDFAIVITKAACVLHNYVQRRDGCSAEDSFKFVMNDVLGKRGVGNATTNAKAVREYFVKYFNDPENALS